jgi:hypothetical protein
MALNTFSPRRRRDAEKEGRRNWENAERAESAYGHDASDSAVVSAFTHPSWVIRNRYLRPNLKETKVASAPSGFSEFLLLFLSAPLRLRGEKALLVTRSRYLWPSLKEIKVTSAPSAFSEFLLLFLSAPLRLCGEKELEVAI